MLFHEALVGSLSSLKTLSAFSKAVDCMIAVPVKEWNKNYIITPAQFCAQRVKEPRSAIHDYKFHTFRYNNYYYFIRLI